MKRNLIYAGMIMIMFSLVVFAQNNNQSTTRTGNTDKSSMKDDNKSSMNQKDDDTMEFVKEAASGGMMEVQLGKLAQTKASSKDVRDFGAMMVKDHSKANDQLKAAAKKNNIMVPTSLMDKHQKMVDKLSKLSGREFDEEYVNQMVDDHKEDVDKFKETAQKEKNPDIKKFAQNTLPVLQKHLDHIQQIEKRMDSMSRSNDNNKSDKKNNDNGRQ